MSTFCDWEQTTKVIQIPPKSWVVFTESDTLALNYKSFVPYFK